MATQPDGDWRGNGLYRREEHDACGVGFVAQLGEPASHRVVEQALECLACLTHRGAVDADGASGDGAGIMVQLPAAFFAREAARLDPRFKPQAKSQLKLAAGVFFLPIDDSERAAAMAVVETVVRQRGLEFVGWRPVPMDTSVLGRQARETLPAIWHLLIAPPHSDTAHRTHVPSEPSDAASASQSEREFEQ